MKLSSLTLLIIGSLLSCSAITAAAEVPTPYHSYTCEMTGSLIGDNSMGPRCMLVGKDCLRWHIICDYYCEVNETKGQTSCPAGQIDYHPSCELLLPDGKGKTPAKVLSVTLFYNQDGHVVPGLNFASESGCNDYISANTIVCLSANDPEMRELAKTHCPAKSVTVNSSCARNPKPAVIPKPALPAPAADGPTELL